MPKAAKPLTALSIRRAKPGYVADGNGLYLQVTNTGARSWIYRYSLHGRRREMGLGAFPTISIATARNLAAGARSLVLAGDDPIEARDAERVRKRLEGARSITFTQAAEQFLQSHEGTWKNSKHRQQWRNTLATYAHPVIGSLPVADVHTEEVVRLLDPIWKAKADTASRVRARVERVLDWAKVRGYRSGENPARWRGHLDKVFPARRKVRKVKHHAAVPIDDMSGVYTRLSAAIRAAAALISSSAIGDPLCRGTVARSSARKQSVWMLAVRSADTRARCRSPSDRALIWSNDFAMPSTSRLQSARRSPNAAPWVMLSLRLGSNLPLL